MSETITHDEWVKLVATLLNQLCDHNVLWDTRMKVQAVMVGSTVVLPPDENVLPLRDLP